MTGAAATKLIFLGGSGEIGRAMTLFEHDSKILIVDCGLMFPSEEMLGVDLVLPDFTYVRDRASDVVAVLLTHGHEDHIGAVPFLLKEVDAPIYGAPLTLGLLTARLEEHGLSEAARLFPVKAPGEIVLGPFTIRLFNMTHSIPDCLGLLIQTSAGRMLYTGDFKVERDPVQGAPIDLAGLGEAARQGIDLLLSDSTAADRPGQTPSERIVGQELAQVISRAEGRVIVACFASNIHRIQQIADAALQSNRVIAFIGRSMVANVKVARNLGYLTIEDSLIVPIEEIDKFPPEKIVVISTGSQGEPLSALSLMAARDHKWIDLLPQDTVVLSATPIPGNELAVRRVIDGLFRVGCDVITAPARPVHVSGHASAEDLKLVIELIRPKWFVPVHGEFRQLALHARIAEEVGLPSDRIQLVEDGDVLELSDGGISRLAKVPAGYVYVDGLGIGDVGDVVLRDRRLLAGDGIVVCVVALDSQSGEVVAGPDVISRGFVHEDESADFLEEARAEIRESLEVLTEDEIRDWAQVRRVVRKSLGKFVWERTGRRPIVLPVVMEV